MCGVRPSRTYSSTRIPGGRSGACGTNASRRATLAPRRARDDLVAVERDRARRSATSPRDRAQERALAGAVRPDQRDPLARRDRRRVTPSSDGAPPSSTEQRVERERRHEKLLLVRSTIAKNGAPKNAVTTPIGSSAGETTVRASTSREHEEAAADEQRERQDDPVARPDREPDAVGDDDPDEADQPADRDRRRPCRSSRRRRSSSRTRRTLTPSVAASSSPTASTSSSRRCSRITTELTTTYGRDERDLVPARGVELPEDPAVDLLQRLGVLLLDERLDRGQERARP